jgi:NodT family efflux transporter outer membrane factor (OMF) lipoprotein
MRRWPLLLAALPLSACAVGPNYRSPEPAAPSQTPFMGTSAPAFTGDEPPGRWWSLFRDPLLDRLIEQALAANTDLRVAAANLARARAVLRESRAGRLPTTGISASAAYSRAPGNAAFPGVEREGDSYDAGLDVSYQLDLFGRIRRTIEASRADADAAQASFDLSRVTVAAETARAYADACGTGRRLDVARESLRVQERSYDLTRRLLEGGRGTALELNQSGALLEQVRSTIPVLEAQREAALFRLAVLTGRPPVDFPREVAACNAPPALAQLIPVGDGASLLRRRPDIREAERRLAAAIARIGVATADLYPTISIGGSIGSTANSPGGLVSSEGFRFSLGPLLTWSFPNIAVARARIAQAEASSQAALAEFDGIWLRALQETETALTRYARGLDQVASLRRARDRSAEAARIARLRFQGGRDSFLTVLDAERTLAQNDAAFAQAEAQLSDNLISLFLALGGGWQDEAAT